MQGCNIIEIGRLIYSSSDELLDQLKSLGYYIQTRERKTPQHMNNVIEHIIYKKEEEENVKKRRKSSDI